ncbi:hypothetical protein CesoFtcFv8_016933 [Champsocephalus esox]|uniref:Uncharacterized protein n=1 Tax=Champsocephalus esox TaxID=159716 RepID=A0AAN8BIH8_9TELE|nr:hypothetical protein CesoFtcFv8_016933 [Champsocephalus esox]
MLLPCRFCTRMSLICPINSSRSNHSCPAIVKRGELQGSRPGAASLPGWRRSCCGQEGTTVRPKDCLRKGLTGWVSLTGWASLLLGFGLDPRRLGGSCATPRGQPGGRVRSRAGRAAAPGGISEV